MKTDANRDSNGTAHTGDVPQTAEKPPSSKLLTFRVPQCVAADVDKRAQATGRRRSDVLREALEYYLAHT